MYTFSNIYLYKYCGWELRFSVSFRSVSVFRKVTKTAEKTSQMESNTPQLISKLENPALCD